MIVFTNAPRSSLSAKKPIILLLENYVLAAIGELPAEEHGRAQILIKHAFGESAGGSWQDKLREEFGVNESLDEQLRNIWSQAQKLAAEKTADLDARDFAATVVEENFTDAVEMIAAAAEAAAEADPHDDDD